MKKNWRGSNSVKNTLETILTRRYGTGLGDFKPGKACAFSLIPASSFRRRRNNDVHSPSIFPLIRPLILISASSKPHNQSPRSSTGNCTVTGRRQMKG
ncbi:hypothetical protein A2U01_0017839 [Trifolium medium]|uniref:Uncharacterized protein n=1 Tax=Trifolium medium TaxID=97028 RepID=A0A392NCE2_9FABA|nr:hypothetical protein [Trifolium medium]